MESNVSRIIGQMPFLWLAIEDAPGRESMRGYIEKNSIALLSNAAKTPIDAPSPDWLGHFSSDRGVLQSGLWNTQHVYEQYDENFLDYLSEQVNSVASD